ncbi:hypothetical protein ACOZXQ_002185 [Cronobacter malonaticus]
MEVKPLANAVWDHISHLKQMKHYNYLKGMVEYEKLKGDLSGLNIYGTNCDTGIEFGLDIRSNSTVKVKLGNVHLEDVKTGIKAPDTYSIETGDFTMKRGEAAIDIYTPSLKKIKEMGFPDHIHKDEILDLLQKINAHHNLTAQEQASKFVDHPAFKWLSHGVSVTNAIEKIAPIVEKIIHHLHQ